MTSRLWHFDLVFERFAVSGVRKQAFLEMKPRKTMIYWSFVAVVGKCWREDGKMMWFKGTSVVSAGRIWRPTCPLVKHSGLSKRCLASWLPVFFPASGGDVFVSEVLDTWNIPWKRVRCEFGKMFLWLGRTFQNCCSGKVAFGISSLLNLCIWTDGTRRRHRNFAAPCAIFSWFADDECDVRDMSFVCELERFGSCNAFQMIWWGGRT